MDRISSGEFRKLYAKLTEPTIVTVNGHVIGVWQPGSPLGDGKLVWPDRDKFAIVDPLVGPSFNSRGSRPVPKR